MPRSPLFARRVFLAAGIYGLVAMAPQYLFAEPLMRSLVPAPTHPENFYGFVGVAIAWQLAFLAIGRDPVRHRPLMPAAIAEKLLFAVPAIVLWVNGRVATAVVPFAGIDLLLAALFTLSYVGLRPDRLAAQTGR